MLLYHYIGIIWHAETALAYVNDRLIYYCCDEDCLQRSTV